MAQFIQRTLFASATLRGCTKRAFPSVGVGVRLLANQAKQWSNSELDDTVKKNKVVVFMKGSPDAPMCGFSRAVVQILDMHGLKEFTTFDVLSNDNLRKNIKEFSNWPTIPQIYINGEFVGGCDIMIQLHKSGELIDELEKIGHRSALLDANSE